VQPATLVVRKVWTQVEEVRLVAGTADGGGPLRKVAACAVVTNPYAGAGHTADLSALVDGSAEIGGLLGAEAARALGAPPQSYGKAALAGLLGEQEHANAVLTSVFGDALRAAVGGGAAWISSTTKVATPGQSIDVPLAYKDEIWVRSHYDTVEVRVPDAPLPHELVIIAALANRGRINARLGGLTLDQARAGAAP
jgi:hypothetical protein